MVGRLFQSTVSQALPPISAVIKDSREPLEPIYYCRNGREGLAYGALKLSALCLSPVDHFGNYIFEISRLNCIICTINWASTLTFVQNLFPAWCVGSWNFPIFDEKMHQSDGPDDEVQIEEAIRASPFAQPNWLPKSMAYVTSSYNSTQWVISYE